MLRSSRRLQQERSLLERINDLARDTGDSDVGWGQFAAERRRERIAQIEEELAEIRGELEWAFDGLGVYGHSIAFNRLVALIGPLGQTLRGTARDLLFLDGAQAASTTADSKELIEPVITGSFDGSFGLRISGPPVTEQISFEGTLFERTASRIVEIFRAAHSEEAQTEILDLVGGLRKTTISGLQRLTEELSRAGKASRIRWQGETVITVTPSDAEVLYETISAVEPSEQVVEIQARFWGGDLDSSHFHLVVSEEPRPKHYRGKAEEAARDELRGIPLGAAVSATLVVVETSSPLLPEPKETYVLRQVRPIGGA